MSLRGRRKLSGDEQVLWAHVVASVTPLKGRRKPPVPVAEPPPASASGQTVVAETGGPPAVSAPQPKPTLKPLAPIERRLRQRVSRGQSPIDGILDLHGMRQDEAHRALLGFIQRKHHDGATLVIVVTGKGGRPGEGRDGGERGVLRRLVPHWLGDPGLRRCVVGFESAPHHHGGEGALYVRIRRAPTIR